MFFCLSFHQSSQSRQATKQVATPTSLNITCWNCRGLSNSTHYLNADGSDVIIISKHWLWPFELHQLEEIHPDFTCWSQADSRLTNTSDSTRACSGVGVIWHQNLCNTTISGSDSDCICCIRIKIKVSQQLLSIIAVYLPCAALGADYYRECQVELERISEESKVQPLLWVISMPTLVPLVVHEAVVTLTLKVFSYRS